MLCYIENIHISLISIDTNMLSEENINCLRMILDFSGPKITKKYLKIGQKTLKIGNNHRKLSLSCE